MSPIHIKEIICMMGPTSDYIKKHIKNKLTMAKIIKNMLGVWQCLFLKSEGIKTKKCGKNFAFSRYPHKT